MHNYMHRKPPVKTASPSAKLKSWTCGAFACEFIIVYKARNAMGVLI